MSLSRRRFLLTSLALSAGATGLAGCNASANSEAPAEPAPSGAEAGAFPVIIAHKFGETTITAEPRRVVTVGLKEQDDCLAVGVVPVGSTKWFELGAGGIIGPWAEAALGSTPAPTVLTDTDGIQFEKIAALQPDLILAVYQGVKKSDYDKLAALAPTVAQSKDHQDWGVPWEVEATMVGQALGRSAQMAELVTSAKKKVADTAAAHPEFSGKTGLVATPWEGVFVYGIQDPRPRLLTELGFILPEGLDKATGSAWGGQLSTERVDLLDTDTIIWLVEGDGRKTIEANKAYTSLAVHKEGREIFTKPGDNVYEALSFLTVLSVGYLVEQLAPRLAAAVDGDTATITD